MKNLILTTTFIAAGTLAAFAAAPTGTYIDEGGNTQNFVFEEGGDPSRPCYSLTLYSGTYKNVKIYSNDSIDLEVWIIGSGVNFEGFTFSNVNASRGYFYDGVGSVLGRNIEFSNVVNSYIWGKLSSGTHFSIDSNSDIYFYSNIWDIAADLTQSLVESAGKVGMDPDETFTLNFLSAELLKEQTICLFSAGTQVYTGYYSGFKDIAITLNGKVVSDYIATQSKDGKTISISRAVPEPSLFGLLAGTLALALAGTRRRHK